MRGIRLQPSPAEIGRKVGRLKKLERGAGDICPFRSLFALSIFPPLHGLPRSLFAEYSHWGLGARWGGGPDLQVFWGPASWSPKNSEIGPARAGHSVAVTVLLVFRTSPFRTVRWFGSRFR